MKIVEKAAATGPGCLRFGPFQLDPLQRRLYRDGRVVLLTPKVFDTLLVLVEHHGRVVTKDELMAAIWPDRMIEEANLTQNISVLRRTLGNGDGQPQWIVTVPGRGYQFAALVEDSDGYPGARRARANVLFAAVGAAALLLLALLLPLLREDDRMAPSHRFSQRRLTEIGNIIDAAFSPDGRQIAFVTLDAGLQSLRLRPVDSTGHTELIATSENALKGVTFSPSGTDLFYVLREKNSSGASLYRLPAFRGVPERVKERVHSPVTFNPDGNRYAFVREDTGAGESMVVVASRGSSEEQRLASRKLPEYLDFPAWSPDGEHIACVVHETARDRSGILLISTRTGEQRRLGEPRWRFMRRLSWLDGGQSLVAVGRALGASAWSVWLVSAAGGAAHSITPDTEDHCQIHAARDGRRLIGVRGWKTQRLLVTDSIGNGDVAPGTDWVTLGPESDDGRGVSNVSWLPDGRVVVAQHDQVLAAPTGKGRFEPLASAINVTGVSVCGDGRSLLYESDSGGYLETWRLDLDGGSTRRIVEGGAWGRPICSPDGKWAVYSGHGPQGWPVLWKASTNGGPPVQLTDAYALLPAVSPDGRLVAAFYGLPQTERQAVQPNIAIFPIEGGPPVKLLPVPETANQHSGVRWTRDGQSIVYVDLRDGFANLWAASLDGTRRKLTDLHVDQMFDFDWSWDGSQLAVVVGAEAHDMVLMEHR